MSLRDEITTELQRANALVGSDMDFRRYGYCTWWFPHHINRPTKACRAELKRMERDGLVKADRSQSNNTKWLLTASDTATHRAERAEV